MATLEVYLEFVQHQSKLYYVIIHCIYSCFISPQKKSNGTLFMKEKHLKSEMLLIKIPHKIKKNIEASM